MTDTQWVGLGVVIGLLLLILVFIGYVDGWRVAVATVLTTLVIVPAFLLGSLLLIGVLP
jgi:hypothetical protein